MILKTMFLSLILCCFSISPLFACQEDDPFGSGGSSGDPFAKPPAAKPPAAKPPAEKAAAPAADEAADAAGIAAEEKIRATLSDETSFDFFEQPLTDVVEFLRDQHKINAQLDVGGLDLAGISPEDQVTKSLSGVSLRSGLRLLLRDLHLTYVIYDEALHITSYEEAEQTTTAEIHDISGIANQYTGDLVTDFPDMIRKIIDPDSWSADKKPGSGEVVAMSFGNDRHYLIVRQTSENHRAITNLISELQKKVK